MIQTTKQGRPFMPDWCLLLLKRAEASRFAGPLPAVAANRCVVCSAAEDNAVDHAGEGNLYRCGTCLAVWHSDCAAMDCFGGMGRLEAPALCSFCKRLS